MEATIFTTRRRIITQSLESLDHRIVELAVVPDFSDELRGFVSNGLSAAPVSFNGGVYGLIHNGFMFPEKPEVSHSRDRVTGTLLSHALYIAKKFPRQGLAFVLQYLPPYSHTSRHYHRETTEIYHSLAGSCTVFRNGSPTALSGAQSLPIYTEVIHQARTTSQPSLMLLEIRGAGNPLEGDHHHVAQGRYPVSD